MSIRSWRGGRSRSGRQSRGAGGRRPAALGGQCIVQCPQNRASVKYLALILIWNIFLTKAGPRDRAGHFRQEDLHTSTRGGGRARGIISPMPDYRPAGSICPHSWWRARPGILVLQATTRSFWFCLQDISATLPNSNNAAA